MPYYMHIVLQYTGKIHIIQQKTVYYMYSTHPVKVMVRGP